MTKSFAAGFSLWRAALLGAASLALAGAAGAQSRVGVTSATNGDPLGKPPTENERILRVGIDVQANELITTATNDRAHLLFLDGTSLTVGPNAQLTIDRFVYDPASKTGALAINVSKGVFRLVGGRISKTNDITVSTPSGTIGIRGGITIGDVQSNHTTSTFVFGDHLTMTGQGQTQTATRPGSQITSLIGAIPGPPILVPHGGLGGLLGQLEGTTHGGGGGSTLGANADRGAQGFAHQNVPPPAPFVPPQAIRLVSSNLITNVIAPSTQTTAATTSSSSGSTDVNGNGCIGNCGNGGNNGNRNNGNNGNNGHDNDRGRGRGRH